MSMASRIWASTKCPMRHFAMTGMDTASWMPLDHGRVAHAGHAAGRADVGGDALEGHDGARARLLGDVCLLGRGDVHDDAALQHLGQIFRLSSARFCVMSFPSFDAAWYRASLLNGVDWPHPNQSNLDGADSPVSAPIQSNLHMFISPIWHVIADCQSITGQEEERNTCDYLLFA